MRLTLGRHVINAINGERSAKPFKIEELSDAMTLVNNVTQGKK